MDPEGGRLVNERPMIGGYARPDQGCSTRLFPLHLRLLEKDIRREDRPSWLPFNSAFHSQCLDYGSKTKVTWACGEFRRNHRNARKTQALRSEKSFSFSPNRRPRIREPRERHLHSALE